MTLDAKLEDFRVQEGRFSTRTGATWGLFIFPANNIGARSPTRTDEEVRCIADNGRDARPDGTGASFWEHVSVSILDRHDDYRMPTWMEMDAIKRLFWAPDETVVQYHPAEEDAINFHDSVLHLWRPVREDLPTPPKDTIGPKTSGPAPGTTPAR